MAEKWKGWQLASQEGDDRILQLRKEIIRLNEKMTDLCWFNCVLWGATFLLLCWSLS